MVNRRIPGITDTGAPKRLVVLRETEDDDYSAFLHESAVDDHGPAVEPDECRYQETETQRQTCFVHAAQRSENEGIILRALRAVRHLFQAVRERLGIPRRPSR